MRTITKTYRSNTYEYTLKIVFTDSLRKYLKKYFIKWGMYNEEAIDAAGVCLRHPSNIE